MDTSASNDPQYNQIQPGSFHACIKYTNRAMQGKADRSELFALKTHVDSLEKQISKIIGGQKQPHNLCALQPNVDQLEKDIKALRIQNMAINDQNELLRKEFNRFSASHDKLGK